MYSFIRRYYSCMGLFRCALSTLADFKLLIGALTYVRVCIKSILESETNTGFNTADFSTLNKIPKFQNGEPI